MTLKKIPFWHTRLAGSPETIPYSSGSIFKYHTPAVKNLGGISSSTLLEGHARHLAHALALYGEHTPPHVVLVGHGYGGLICEQVRRKPFFTIFTDKLPYYNHSFLGSFNFTRYFPKGPLTPFCIPIWFSNIKGSCCIIFLLYEFGRKYRI